MTPRFTLSKKERLKSLKRIKFLFEQGDKFKVSPLVVYYRYYPTMAGQEEKFPLKMGVSVGSKYFKKAVDRNLMKRRIREAFRIQKISLQEQLKTSDLSMDVFFVFAHATMVEYKIVTAAMEAAMEKLTTLIEKR